MAQAVAYPLGYATIGLVLGLRRPANPIGWLYAASGLVWALIIPFEPWAPRVVELVRDQRPRPLAVQLGVVAGAFDWAPAITLGITLPFLLLPDGRLRSGRWRVMVAGVAMFVVGGSLTPGQRWTVEPIPMDNPLGLGGVAGTVAAAVTFAGLALYAVSLLAALVCMVLRFRASGGWSASSSAGSLPAPQSRYWCCCHCQEMSTSLGSWSL